MSWLPPGSRRGKPNVWLFDERSNHLDLEPIETLVKALRACDGTLIFVAHDRWFVDELATRVMAITPEGIDDFVGTADETLACSGEDYLDAEHVIRKARASKR